MDGKVTKEEAKEAEIEFYAIIAGGQNNKEFYQSVRHVVEFFKRLREEQ